MAILGKIRKRSFFLIVVIALALFAFVLMDLIQSGGFLGSNSYVGSVNGKDISVDEFNSRVAFLEKNGNNGQGMSNTQAVKQVWDGQVNVLLLEEEFNKLGLRIGVDHLIEKLKQNPDIAGRFTNELGVFDKKRFDDFLKNTANEQERLFIKEQENNAKINAQYQIYNNMIRAGLFVTQADAKFLHKLDNQKVDFEYVHVPFTSINDSEVKVSKQEVMDYMKKHEKRYKSEEVRFIDYVFISEQASDADKKEIEKELTGLLENRVENNDTLIGFRKTKNIAEFLNINSEIPYDSTYYSKTDLPAEYADNLYELATGEFFGPYEFGEYLAITKSEGKKAGAKARASHILISYDGAQGPGPQTPRTKEEAQQKAKELLSEVRADDSKMVSLAMSDSDDVGSARQGGDLNFFNPGQMVPPFNDFVFNNSTGSIGMVETDFGFHIIKVTDKQDAVRLATLARKIVPSKETSDTAYKTALDFEKIARDKTFEKALSELKLVAGQTVRATPLEENFGELGPQRQIIKWAYERGTKVNDIKQIELTNKGFVIAKLKSIDNTGFLPFEEAKVAVEPLIRNEKKAKIISDKLKGKSLADAAAAYKVSVEKASDVNLSNPILPNAGFEPKVVGVAMKLDKSKTSEPIEGNAGVYVVKSTKVTKPAETDDYSQQFNVLKNTSNQVLGKLFTALKDLAKVKDYRVEKFQY